MRPGVLLIVGLAAATAGVTWFVPPFTLPPSYYDFADRRTILGIPNFMDVVSNLPWLLIGSAGLVFVGRHSAVAAHTPFADSWERMAFAVLFADFVLLAFGSGLFHVNPTIATLLWDRLPMAIGFMCLFAIVIADRIDRRAGRVLFVPMLLLAIASVLQWRYTESLGRGDVRLYGLVQFFPMLALPGILWIFPGPRERTVDLIAALVWYGAAKLFELADARVFSLTAGTISGHTLKHLAGGLAALFLLRLMMRPRATTTAQQRGQENTPGRGRRRAMTEPPAAQAGTARRAR